MNTNNIIACFLLFIFISCSTLNRNDTIEQTSIIENCRKNWEYKSLNGIIELEILEHTKKSHTTSISYPSFFIGVTTQKDTIGMIDYFSEGSWKKGDILKFSKDQYGKEISKKHSSMSNKPIFYTYGKNPTGYQCSINTIYYGKILEVNN